MLRERPPGAVPRGAPRRLDAAAGALAALAAALVGAGISLGWRGVDFPAQLYRVDLFHRHGFALWDSQWYGGHWLLDYSVIFPAVAAAVGVATVTLASAVVATLAFDRLVVGHIGPHARAASVVFAFGVTVQSSIGQLTFLLGEAAGLCCLVAVGRRRWGAAAALAVVATLASPLAGAFVALAVVTSWVATTDARRPTLQQPGPGPHPPRLAGLDGPLGRLLGRVRAGRGHGGVLAAVAVPVVATSVLFPGQGPMPYPFTDYLWELVVAVVLWALTPRHFRPLRLGAILFALAATASEVVATPLGGNVGRLEDLVALPLAVAMLWDRPSVAAARGVVRHLGPAVGRPAVGWRMPRLALVAVAVPLAVSQWAPAWPAITTAPGRPWVHAAYYRPLAAYLVEQPGPAGRTEVVPTAGHSETEYVAPTVALARGWERQLDEGDNPIFYRRGALDAASYRAWLIDNGVRWVALPGAPLDIAGSDEGALVARGVAGLTRVWRSHDWSVYEVVGSPGIVGAGGHLVRLDGGQVTVAIAGPAPVTVRVRWSPAWQVTAGGGTVTEAPGRWLLVTAARPGLVRLRVRLF